MSKRDLQRDFEKFHADNPHVLEELERRAREWFAQGHSHVAIGMLWELLRWVAGTQTNTTEPYRLNNNHRSRYVRLMLQRNPEWDGRFRIRELDR